MQSSSLIFVIVVAIWAVYLLQYWVKRRDHLSTVRSVDRFSAAMRVLDHHRLGREGIEPAPRSYAVAPTRAARPTVTVKRAEAPVETAAPVRPTAGDPLPSRPAETPGLSPLVARVVDAPRRVRGLTFLVHLALLPVVLLVAAFGPLPWWTPVVLLVGTAGAFGWLRQGVIDERAAAQARRRAAAPAARRAERPVAQARPAAARTAAAPVAAPAPQRKVREEQVYDVAPVTVEVPGVAEVPEAEEIVPAAPGSWDPVPVPRPTYTMKAKAHRAEPAPLPETMAPVEADLDELPAVDNDLVDPGTCAVNG